jgi:hypothetical protein
LEQGSLDIETSANGRSEEGQLLSCRRAVLFVTFPQKDTFGRMLHTDRVDIAGLSGQAPISLRRLISSPTETAKSAGSRNFPIAPSISSFKARQEDDDEELGAPQVDGVNEGISSVLKPPDPQTTMLRATANCQEAIEVSIPALSLDLTRAELDALVAIFTAVFPRNQENRPTNGPIVQEESGRTNNRALLLLMDQVHVSLHSAVHPSTSRDEELLTTFSFIGDRWKTFALFLDSNRKCYRFMAHEFDVYFGKSLLVWSHI